ncbi:hypothetical protein Kole_0334 [Kosmotoga olearia TBF 19.5.1]|uniref:Uncharacterized protein n=1 Tax=Kosmotoga olearia (strain ATCC BAA-1733 / DSM 21960 / TBF 19.5.1) TaxID=521045 RepID=C5CDH5_KOSOT|nr:hypothetical protein Kole_0334 [Kosmotoga olearia TBF 19.5.1]
MSLSILSRFYFEASNLFQVDLFLRHYVSLAGNGVRFADANDAGLVMVVGYRLCVVRIFFKPQTPTL